jgi:hypothetical protein
MNLRSHASRIAVLALLAGPASALPPPQPVSPFDMIGVLQSATLGGSDSLAGGTVTVHGQVVTIPRNTVVLLPATALTWQELFRLAPSPYGPNQTGLAQSDIPAPTTTWQVHVTGNRVGDQYIAGLVSVTQDELNAGQGWVNAIDYSTGEFRVGGVIGDPTTGQRVRLNDPVGRFGRITSPDVRFTIDEENPTVRATTGYPMCIPRTDPAAQDDWLCPQGNRPRDPTTGGFLSIFHTPDPALGVMPDANRAAPFEVGDYVTYSGILVKDGTSPTAGAFAGVSSSYVAAYSVVANVGIFTAYGTDPAYVAIDVTILGVGGAPIAGVPQEATARTRFEGFTTDPSRTIYLYGIDVDPCTGAQTDRDWGSVAVDPGPPVGAVFGRWRFRPPTKVLSMPLTGVFLPATREVRARLTPSQPFVTANGLSAGQYHAPITEYLFPENLAVGGPVVPLNFQEFPFLANGSGPWPGGGPNGVPGGIVGQLSPWPGSPVPTAPSCAGTTPVPPTANAGAGQTVASGALVTLDGSQSSDPNGQSLTYSWKQTGGTTVTLSSPSVARPTFTAPIVPTGSSPASLVFSLTVQDAFAASTPSSVTIVVNPVPAAATAPVANAGLPQTVGANALVTLNGSASADTNSPPLSLTYGWTQASGAAVTLTGASTATPTFTAPSSAFAQALSFTLTVTNSAGLRSTGTATVNVNAVTAPTANAGAAQAVKSGVTVSLDGSASFDPQALPLTYSWTQVSGPKVTLTGANTAKPTFVAPNVGNGAGPQDVVLALTVSNGFIVSTPAQVTITVQSVPDLITITLVEYRTSKQRLTVNASSSVTTGAATLTCTIPNLAPTVMTNLGKGNYSVVFVGVPMVGSVTVTSSLGGSATSGITSIKP